MFINLERYPRGHQFAGSLFFLGGGGAEAIHLAMVGVD